ncbi:2,3-dihydroxybenzoate-AMP ligase [Actinophytocola xinjiangensis]|uniref:2,3-dihydroxybenzoate-AMP ligase n=1 Tax=Actinophytocola xinjiangensis TaxID=485602 RepID=A0A7Z0WF17_9PSEU|nr:AMP-binding protein [Actinophytocola xinjiangensis]OLF05829.1 2,3-dihydroxybenzoate-AMP ligase [Actinophytocola xinjiangensis]
MQRDGFTPWPAEFVERYTSAGYWRGKPLGHWLWSWADERGERVAIVDGEYAITYQDLAEHADALADNLLDLGLREGDNILVQLPNTWEFVALFLACQRIGVAPVLALLAHREHELNYLADLAHVRAIVVPDTWQRFDHQRLAGDLAESLGRPCEVLVLGEHVDESHVDLRTLLERGQEPTRLRARLDAQAPDPGEIALFLLSGGTTGTPKIISRTHQDYEYNARQSGAVCGFDESTVYLVTLPMGHNFPLGSPGILATLIHGGRVVMIRSPKPEVAFPAIERERATVTSLVPAIAQRWVEAAATTTHDLSSLDLVQVGGSVIDPAFAARIGPALGCTLQQVYGMAEGLLNYTRPHDPVSVTNHTQGRPISEADEILIVDEDGRPVPFGGTGELLTRGPYTPRGYFRAPDHNARAYTPDGWYRTGDLVRWHRNGNFVVEGRVKDLINRGGEKISAPEVEAVVDLLPAVRRVSAIALPDPEYGELVCVCVVLHEDYSLTLDEVRALFAAQGVAKFKHPQQLEIVTDFPLTAVGKVDKKALRQDILARGESRAA